MARQARLRLGLGSVDLHPAGAGELELPRLSLAVVQYRTGNVQEARDSLERLLELSPGVAIARKMLNEIRMRR